MPRWHVQAQDVLLPDALAQVTWRALPPRRQVGGQPCRSGCWSLEFGEDLFQARWFSLQLTQEDVPYLFEREPQWAVTTLELFAALVGLMVLVPREKRSGKTWLLQKLVTTKSPLCLASAEMAEQMRIRDLAMALKWRLLALTNLDFSAFRSELRVHVCWSELSFWFGQSIRVQGRGRGPAGGEEGKG